MAVDVQNPARTRFRRFVTSLMPHRLVTVVQAATSVVQAATAAVLASTAAILIASVPAAASTFIATTDDELAAESVAVVTGTVTDVLTRRTAGSGRIATDYTVNVDAVLSGAIRDSADGTVVVSLPGGAIADAGERVLDVPVFTRGDRVRLYLKDIPPTRGPATTARARATDDASTFSPAATALPDPRRYRVTGMALGARKIGESPLVDRYTFYTNGGDTYLRWYSDTVDVRIDSALTPDVNASEARNAITDSMDTWNAVDCIHPTLVDAGDVTGIDAIVDASGGGQRANNLIIFEDMAAWNENRSDDDEWDASKVVALSTMFHNARTGEIMSFALELNDDAFTFAVTGIVSAIDIQNTVTHELGHVLGLDHTTADVVQYWKQTMYYQTSPGETQKRSLESDDIDGICALYAQDWKPDTGCFAAASPAGRKFPVMPVLSMLVIMAGLLVICRIRGHRGAAG